MSKRSQVLDSSGDGPSTSKRNRISEVASQEGAPEEDEILKAGKLLHIHLRNFMCHSHFKLDFNSRMNFILGHNGSGKSCILTAIIIGLGGSARATNRSNTVSKLVKTGEQSATIEIHLANVGPDAFEREKYGGRIIVVRSIKDNGTGSYQLLSENRAVISKSKKQLDLIMRYFEITVNNPITVLTQDCARTFLRDCDSKARFVLFKKGAGLETIEEEIAACEEYAKSIEAHLLRRKEKSNYYRSERKERRKVYEMLQSADRARERIVKLELELQWIEVREEEEVLKAREDQLQSRVADLSAFTNQVQAIETKKTTIEDTIKAINVEVAKVETSQGEHDAAIAAKKEELAARKDEFFSIRKTFQSLDNKVKQLRRDIQKIDQDLSELTQQESRDVFEREVAELREQRATMEAEITEKSARMREAQNRITEFEEDLYGLQEEKQRLGRSVTHCREQMNLIRDETDNLAVYGSHMPQLLKALERNKARFSQPPIGPIGRYLEVPDMRHRAIIDQLVAGSVATFIVNTPKDNEEFFKLFSKEFPRLPKPSVIQRPFRHTVYDTTKLGVRPPPNTTTVLEQLRCKNAVVMNTLIDLLRIDQCLICETMAVGRKMTENIENVPQNLKRVIVMEPLCEMFPQPNFRIYSLTPKRTTYIQVSAEEKKNQLREIFDEKNALYEEAKERHGAIENETLGLKQCRKNLQSQLAILHRKMRDIDSKISDITQDHLEPRVEEDTLLEEKATLTGQLERLEVQHAPQKEKIDVVKTAMETLGEAIKAMGEMHAEYDSKVREARTKADLLLGKKERLEVEKSDRLHLLRECEQRVTQGREECEEQRAEVQRKTELLGGERIRTRKTREEVRENIATLNAQRQVSTQIKESLEEVGAELVQLDDRIEQLDSQYEVGCKTLRVQEQAVLKHRRAYETRKRVVQTTMGERFKELLAKQSYLGELQIDYQKKTLDLEIHPRQGGTVKGTKSLSGGERSFSTVAFLLSIWSCIEHPFFLLDEYDVFTDGSNRELMTRMLIEEANAKPYNQYMFLTPQDVSHLITPSAELGVFKMPDKK